VVAARDPDLAGKVAVVTGGSRCRRYLPLRPGVVVAHRYASCSFFDRINMTFWVSANTTSD
jgi:hypothetical protein